MSGTSALERLNRILGEKAGSVPNAGQQKKNDGETALSRLDRILASSTAGSPANKGAKAETERATWEKYGLKLPTVEERRQVAADKAAAAASLRAGNRGAANPNYEARRSNNTQLSLRMAEQEARTAKERAEASQAEAEKLRQSRGGVRGYTTGGDSYTTQLEAANAKVAEDQAALRLAEQKQREAADAVAAETDARWKKAAELQYVDIPVAGDYGTYSQPDSKNTDPVYRYINGDAKGDSGEARILAGNIRGGVKIKPYQQYDNLTQDEIGTYNYLYARKGRDAAARYLEDLSLTLSERDAAVQTGKNQQFASEHPVLASAASIPYNLASGAGYLDLAGQKLQRTITGSRKPVDYNSPTLRDAKTGSDIRGQVSADIAERFQGEIAGTNMAAFLYQTGMSIADSAVVVGLTMLGVPAASALLGGSAATQAALEVHKRGGSDAQALGYGLAAGIAEGLFESASIEKLITLKQPKTAWQLLKNVLAQAGIEASEEVSTTLFNTLTDALINGDKSQLMNRMQILRENGATPEQAEKGAWTEWATGLFGDAIGGALSGGVMAGVKGGVQYATGTQQQYSMERKYGIALKALDQMEQPGLIQTVIQAGLDAGKGTQQHTLAQELQGMQQRGMKLPDGELGRLYRLNQANPSPSRPETGTQEPEAAEEAEAQTPTETAEQSRNEAAETTAEESKQYKLKLPGAELAEAARERQATAQTVTAAANPQNAQSRLRRSGTETGAAEESVRAAERIAAALGLDVVFYRAQEGAKAQANGYYSKGTIYLNATSKSPVAQIIAHEMTHGVEAAETYRALKKLIFSRYADADVQSIRDELISRYARAGVDTSAWTEQDVDAEVIAEYVEKQLLTDEAAIRKLVQQDRTLGQRIRDWINTIRGKLGNQAAGERAFLSKAISLYSRALEETGVQYTEVGKSQAIPNFKPKPTGKAQRMEAIDDLARRLDAGEITAEEYDAAMDGIRQEESLAGESELDGGRERYSISDIQGELGNYGTGVVLDSKLLEGVKPRNWDTVLSSFVYNNLAGKTVTVYDEEGQPEEVQFARANDRVRKDGAKNSHKVIDKLTSGRGSETRTKAIIQLDEVLETSRYKSTTDEHSHQWMDENGWEFRTAYIQDTDGKIYEAMLNIAKGRDRRILYEINRVHLIDKKRNSGKHTATGDGRYSRYQESGAGSTQSVVPEPILTGNNSKVKEKYSISPETEEREEETRQKPEQMSRDNISKKAENVLKRAESQLVSRISRALSVPTYVRKDALVEPVHQISNEYLKTGTVSEQTIDDLFESAYEQGRIIDDAFYRENKHIKDYLRKQPVTVSEKDRGDFTDWTYWRRSAFGTLRIVNEGGISIDRAYQELIGLDSGLFPEHINNVGDQLRRMLDVGQAIRIAERTLNEANGAEAESYKAWAKKDFQAAVWDTVGQLQTVRRYETNRAEQEKVKVPAEPMTVDSVLKAYQGMKDAHRKVDIAEARNLLTTRDKAQVGRLLRGELLPEMLDVENDNVQGILAVYEAKRAYEDAARPLREYNVARKEGLRQEADDHLKNAGDWKDKKLGLQYARETQERNVRDVVKNIKDAEAIIDTYFKPVHEAQAASTKAKNSYRDRVRALNLSRRIAPGNEVSEAYAVQLLGEAQDNIRMLEESLGRLTERDGKSLKDWRATIDDLWNKNRMLDKAKIENAVSEFHKIYDELFKQMNEARVRNGYEPINYRSGYFPHFQQTGGDGILAAFGRALGISTEVTALPTSINGMTHAFKPGIQWFGHAQTRKGYDTVYDAVEGFDRYIEGACDVIHQTDNIQRLRALASQIRYRTTDQGLRDQVDAIRENKEISEQDRENRIKEIWEKGKYELSNWVVDLEEYTNLLANKKSRADRTMEQAFGRNFYNAAKSLESRIAANMVAVNPASWLTNLIPLTQGGAQIDSKTIMTAMWDTLRAYKNGDGFAERSTFLTNRRGSDPLVRTWAQQASAVASKPMEYIDNFTSDTLVRARYAQNQRRGLSDAEAMAEADSWAAGIMADRSKGSTPTLFNRSNPLTKLLTQFQLEVNNQVSLLFKDMPREWKDKGAKVIAAMLLKFFFGAWLYNEVYEFFIGRRPAFDPIGMLNGAVGDFAGYQLPNMVELGAGILTGKTPSFKTEKAGTLAGVTNLAKGAADQVPFVGGLLGGGRIPISSALPDVENLSKAAFSDGWSGKKRASVAAKELGKPLLYLAPPFGGGQMKKIFEGIQATIRGGSYTVDGEGKDILQYPVYGDTTGEKIKSAGAAAIFGKTSLPSAREWVDSGFKNYSAKQTAAYQGMTQAGLGGHEAIKIIKEVSAITKTDDEDAAYLKRKYLLEADIDGNAKAACYYAMLATDADIEIMTALDNRRQDASAVAEALMTARNSIKTIDKYKAIIDANIGAVGHKLMLKAFMGENENKRLTQAEEYNVSPKLYVNAKAKAVEISRKNSTREKKSDSISQSDAVEAIRSMGRLTIQQKAAIWQLLCSGSKYTSNPYSSTVGKVICEAGKSEE